MTLKNSKQPHIWLGFIELCGYHEKCMLTSRTCRSL